MVILKLLSQGYYANQISQKGLFSAQKISGIVKWLIGKKLIKLMTTYPKKYELTDNGKLLLKFPNFSEIDHKKDQNVTIEKKLIPKWIERCRAHCLRFKNDLIRRPHWVTQIETQGQIRGFRIRKVKLQNWSKYILYFDHHQFDGVESIEIGITSLIYNFNFGIENEKQYIYPGESIKNYIQKRIDECKRVRAFLLQKEFEIDMGEPYLCQKPHFAFETNGDPDKIGSLSQLLNFSIKGSNGKYWVDDSPKTGGEEETDDIKKAQSVLDVPNKLDQMDDKIHSLENKMDQLISAITNMTTTLTNFFNPPSQGGGINKPIQEGIFS